MMESRRDPGWPDQHPSGWQLHRHHHLSRWHLHPLSPARGRSWRMDCILKQLPEPSRVKQPAVSRCWPRKWHSKPTWRKNVEILHLLHQHLQTSNPKKVSKHQKDTSRDHQVFPGIWTYCIVLSIKFVSLELLGEKPCSSDVLLCTIVHWVLIYIHSTQTDTQLSLYRWLYLPS